MCTANAEGYVREQNGRWVVEVGGWAESTHFGAEVRRGTVARPSWVAVRKCQSVDI